MGEPYAGQLATKQAAARAALAAVAPDPQWLQPQPSPPEGFRNKAKLVVGGRRGAPTLGILDAAGAGVDLRHCGLYEPGLAAALPVLAELVASSGIPPYDVRARAGELKYLIVTHSPDGALMVRFVVRSADQVEVVRALLPRLRQALPHAVVVSVNVHPEHKAVLEGDEEIVLTARAALPMRLDPMTLYLRPRSFFQTNTVVAQALYDRAAQWCAQAAPATVWDLYCGVGGFALRCAAPGRRVVGVEVAPDAVVSARRSAAALVRAFRPTHPAPSLEFVEADATAYARHHDDPDLVVVNPPRRGIGPDLSARLENSQVGNVLYSSCNVTSLAADLRRMPSLRPVRAQVFDMFPQSEHFEVLVHLRRD